MVPTVQPPYFPYGKMESGLKGEEEEGGLLHLRAASGGLGGWEAIGGGGGDQGGKEEGVFIPQDVCNLGGKGPSRKKNAKKKTVICYFT